MRATTDRTPALSGTRGCRRIVRARRPGPAGGRWLAIRPIGGVALRTEPGDSSVAVDRFDHPSRNGRARLVRRLALGAAVAAAWITLPATVLGALPADVAVVAGRPITRERFDHWMFVNAKSSNGPGAPTIVPTDPPRFNHCVARVRATIPGLRSTPAGAIRADCAVLFSNMTQQVLGLLIRFDWQDDEAASDGIGVTAAQVEHAYLADKRKHDPRPGQFRRYLRRTGETIADVKLRVRAELIRNALLETEHLSAGGLDAELTSRFKPQTSCARFYVMSDCAGG